MIGKHIGSNWGINDIPLITLQETESHFEKYYKTTETGITMKRTEELSENNFHDYIRCHNDSKNFYAGVVCRARYKKQNHQLSLKEFNKILKCIFYSLFLSCWKRRPLQWYLQFYEDNCSMFIRKNWNSWQAS